MKRAFMAALVVVGMAGPALAQSAADDDSVPGKVIVTSGHPVILRGSGFKSATHVLSSGTPLQFQVISDSRLVVNADSSSAGLQTLNVVVSTGPSIPRVVNRVSQPGDLAGRIGLLQQQYQQIAAELEQLHSQGLARNEGEPHALAIQLLNKVLVAIEDAAALKIPVADAGRTYEDWLSSLARKTGNGIDARASLAIWLVVTDVSRDPLNASAGEGNWFKCQQTEPIISADGLFGTSGTGAAIGEVSVADRVSWTTGMDTPNSVKHDLSITLEVTLPESSVDPKGGLLSGEKLKFKFTLKFTKDDPVAACDNGTSTLEVKKSKSEWKTEITNQLKAAGYTVGASGTGVADFGSGTWDVKASAVLKCGTMTTAALSSEGQVKFTFKDLGASGFALFAEFVAPKAKK